MSQGTGNETWRGRNKAEDNDFFLLPCYHGWVLSGRTHLIRRISKDNMVLGILPSIVGENTVVQMGTGASAAIPDITDNFVALDRLPDLEPISVIFQVSV